MASRTGPGFSLEQPARPIIQSETTRESPGLLAIVIECAPCSFPDTKQAVQIKSWGDTPPELSLATVPKLLRAAKPRGHGSRIGADDTCLCRAASATGLRRQILVGLAGRGVVTCNKRVRV